MNLLDRPSSICRLADPARGKGFKLALDSKALRSFSCVVCPWPVLIRVMKGVKISHATTYLTNREVLHAHYNIFLVVVTSVKVILKFGYDQIRICYRNMLLKKHVKSINLQQLGKTYQTSKVLFLL